MASNAAGTMKEGASNVYNKNYHGALYENVVSGVNSVATKASEQMGKPINYPDIKPGSFKRNRRHGDPGESGFELVSISFLLKMFLGW